MRTYDEDFRIEGVKLANEIGTTKVAKELNMPLGTLDAWMHKAKNGTFTGGRHTA